MTSVVGVLCADAAVIGTDSAATFGESGVRTIEQPTEKLDIIEDHIILAGTGQVGMGQRFCLHLERGWREDKLFSGKHPPIEACRIVCANTIKDYGSTNAQPGQYGALMAFPCGNQPYICEFAVRDFQPSLLQLNRLWYTSMGSAKPITDPFLGLMRRVFWQSGPPPVAEAVLAVYWTLEHAIELNIGGVNGPIQIAVLEKGGGGKYMARRLAAEEFEEHKQNVRGAYDALREYRQRLTASAAEEAPPGPPGA